MASRRGKDWDDLENRRREGGKSSDENLESSLEGAESQGGLAPFDSKLQELAEAQEEADQAELKRIKSKFEVVEAVEEPENPTGKLRYLAKLFGLQTAEVYTADQFTELTVMTPEMEERVERLYELVKSAENKFELREQVRILNKVFDTTVEATRDIIDHTSNWTEDHSTRLTILAYEIAESMGGFSDEFKKGLLQAGLLHDVGKIGVPKYILDKNGKLEKEERERINRHTTDAQNLLIGLKRHHPYIMDGASHHEWVDGDSRGYPDHLKDTEIPFMSRLLALADVLDAMLDYRPYKNGKSPEQVIKMLQESAGTHFDRVVVAFMVEKYEARGFAVKEYFEPGPREEEINEMLRSRDPFAREKNLAMKRDDVNELRQVVLEKLHGKQKLVDPEDLLELIATADPVRMGQIEKGLIEGQEELEKEVAKMQGVAVDTLFLLIKSVDARYKIYETGTKGEVIGGQQRTENIIRYSLMLAQQMGLSLKEQQRVAIAAMFCDFPVLGADPTKIGMKGILGLTDFNEIKNAPRVQAVALQRFSDPELAKYFDGMEVGATVWSNAKESYGVPLGENGEASLVGKIVEVAYTYTAVRSENLYRGVGFDHQQAMEIMRQGVGDEFDPEVWKAMEELGTMDLLRLFKNRPEVVGIVKKLVRGEEAKISRWDGELATLSELTKGITEEKDAEKKLRLCFEAAEFASDNMLYDQMERLLELAEKLMLESGDKNTLEEMRRLYDYDLEASKKRAIEAVKVRLEEARQGEGVERVQRTFGVIASLISDYAEKGQVLDDDLVEEFRQMIMPVYRECAEELLEAYARDIRAGDYDAAKAKSRTLEIAANDLGDEEFSRHIEMVKQQAAKEREGIELDEYIEQIQKATDPWNGEHYVTRAHMLLEGLSEPNEILAKKLAEVEKKFYRQSYNAMFEQARETAERGEVLVTEELLGKVGEWMERAGREGAISNYQFEKIMAMAYTEGIERMKQLLGAGDLNLEDVPRVTRWVNNINAWRAKLDQREADELSEDLKDAQGQAWAVIRNNLPSEIRELLDDGQMIDTKRFLVTFDEYVVKGAANETIMTPQLEEMLEAVKAKLMVDFAEDMKHRVARGDEKNVDETIQYFKDFCIEPIRNQEGEKMGENIRVELNGTEEAMFHDLKVAVRRQGLELRLRTIEQAVPEVSVAASVTPERRVEAELEKWYSIAGELEGLGDIIGSRLPARLNEAVHTLIVGRVGWALSENNVPALVTSLGQLKSWVERGWIPEVQEEVSMGLEVMIEAHKETLFEELAEQGEWEQFQKFANTLTEWWGEGAKPEVFGRLANECRQKYAGKMEMRMEIYGIKSWLEEMRLTEKKLCDELGISADQLEVADELNDRAAEIIDNYGRVLISCGKFGLLLKRTCTRILSDYHSVRDTIVKVKTPGSNNDGRLLEKILS